MYIIKARHKSSLDQDTVDMSGYREELDRIRNLLRKNTWGMTIGEISSEIQVNRNSVAKYLDVMHISGQVEMRPIGRAKLYFLAKRVPPSAIWNYSSDHILILDGDLEVVQVNDPFLRLLNEKREGIIGEKLGEGPFRVLDSPDIKTGVQNGLVGKDSTLVHSFTVGDEELTLDVRFIPASFEDGSRGVAIVMDDVTKRTQYEDRLREAESRYSFLVEYSKDGIVIVQDGRLIFTNPAACELMGYSSGEMIDRDFSEFISQENQETAMKLLSAGIEDDDLHLPFVIAMIGKNKTLSPVEMNVAPIRYEGRPASLVLLKHVAVA